MPVIHNLVPRVSLLCLHFRWWRQRRETLGTRLGHSKITVQENNDKNWNKKFGGKKTSRPGPWPRVLATTLFSGHANDLSRHQRQHGIALFLKQQQITFLSLFNFVISYTGGKQTTSTSLTGDKLWGQLGTTGYEWCPPLPSVSYGRS